jgi:hypothetical protein
MKRFFVLVVLAFSSVLRPATALAQEGGGEIPIIDCGTMYTSNTSHQFGQFNWLEYIVVTQRSLVLCPIYVQVEAWVVGVEGSALVRTGVFAASARRQIPVPSYGAYQTNGKHWAIWVALWTPGPDSVSRTQILPPPEPEPDPALLCEMQGGRWVGTCELPNCSVIVDTARDGYRLTSVEDGVRFDLNTDGVPEQVAWTRPNSDEAFLALDRNGNGQIDDGSELFGNHTPAYADRADVTAANGFEALKFAEGPSYGRSLFDRQIDARDAVYDRLLLWRDLNHNGISEPDELQPVRESGLVAIGTDYKNKKRVDRYGNEFRQRASVIWEGGEVDDVFDVWLRWRD